MTPPRKGLKSEITIEKPPRKTVSIPVIVTKLPSEPKAIIYKETKVPRETAEHSSEEIRSEPEEQSSQKDLPELSAEPGDGSDFEARMRAKAREVFREMQNEMIVPTTIEDIPPEPATVRGVKGRRQDRDYQKVTLTIDRALWELFEAERKGLSVSAARMMDTILWRYFGRPKLSFEKDE